MMHLLGALAGGPVSLPPGPSALVRPLAGPSALRRGNIGLWAQRWMELSPGLVLTEGASWPRTSGPSWSTQGAGKPHPPGVLLLVPCPSSSPEAVLPPPGAVTGKAQDLCLPVVHFDLLGAQSRHAGELSLVAGQSLCALLVVTAAPGGGS